MKTVTSMQIILVLSLFAAVACDSNSDQSSETTREALSQEVCELDCDRMAECATTDLEALYGTLDECRESCKPSAMEAQCNEDCESDENWKDYALESASDCAAICDGKTTKDEYFKMCSNLDVPDNTCSQNWDKYSSEECLDAARETLDCAKELTCDQYFSETEETVCDELFSAITEACGSF